MSNNTFATKINATIFKKNKKVNIDLNKLKCYNCYKKSYYIKKCFDK